MLATSANRTLDRIISIRNQTVDALLMPFRGLVRKLLAGDDDPRWCQHATYLGPRTCESMILGSITVYLMKQGLWPLPIVSEVGHSIQQLHSILIRVPIYDNDHPECNPRGYLDQAITTVMAEMPDPVSDTQRCHLESQACKLRQSTCSM